MKHAIGTIIFLYVIYRFFHNRNEESIDSPKSQKSHHPPCQSPLLSDGAGYDPEWII